MTDAPADSLRRWARWAAAVGMLAAGGCSGGRVSSGCINDDDCDGGMICFEGLCLQLCNTGADCGVGDACQGGVCVAADTVLTTEFLASSRDVLSPFGFASTEISWSTSGAGAFALRVEGDCIDGLNASSDDAHGRIEAGTYTSTVRALDLREGGNTIRICVTSAASVTAQSTHILVRDDVAPLVSVTPEASDYVGPQDVVLDCDDCASIIYSTDGSQPDFDADGNIATGTLYTDPITTPDRATTTFKVRAIDAAGNVSLVVTAVYAIIPDTPVVTIDSNLYDYVSTGGHSSTTLTWQSDQGGYYELLLHGDCGNGTVARDDAASGSVEAGVPVASRIDADELNPNDSSGHRIRVCVTGNNGLVGSATYTIVRDETPPQLLAPLANLLADGNIDPRLSYLRFPISEPMVTPPDGQLEINVGGSSSSAAAWFTVGAEIKADYSYDPAQQHWVVDNLQPATFLESGQLELRFTPSAGEDLAGNPMVGGTHRITVGARWFAEPVLDTGQTFCADANWDLDATCSGGGPAGQDGEVQDTPQPRSFSAPSADASFPDDFTTTDDVTGLTWQSCPVGFTFDSCSGIPCCLGATTFETSDPPAIHAACLSLNLANNGSGYAGRTDWRLPSHAELWTLINYDEAEPAMDPGAILGPSGGYAHFSGSSMGMGEIGVINFAEPGVLFKPWRGDLLYARCIADASAAALAIDSSLVDIGGGVVADLANDLLWQRCPKGRDPANACATMSSGDVSWTGALAYCAGLTLAGITGWRLPTANEMLTILEQRSGTWVTLNRNVFPFHVASLWTSTLVQVSGMMMGEVTPVFHENGRAIITDEWSGNVGVQCVKDGVPQ